MKPAIPMVHLTSAVGSFHAKVLAARLGSEGVLVNLRGAVDGPYPIFASVEVYVRQDQAAIAREILLADEVDAAFNDLGEDLAREIGGELGGGPWESDPRSPGGGSFDDRIVREQGPARALASWRRPLVALTLVFIIVFVVVGYLAAARSF